MTYNERELAEFSKLCENDPDPSSRDAPIVDGRVDITRAKALLLIVAQNRALGAMVEDIAEKLRHRPKKRPSRTQPAKKRGP